MIRQATSVAGWHSNPSFVQKPAFTIFDEAVALVLQHQAATPAYYYSVAEIGFLQAYAQSSGEAFIRNFLVARQWIDAALPALPVQNLWIPDDFGHDSQLPVAAAAMDFLGAGFSRVPGGWFDNQAPVDGSPSIAAQLKKDGFDFVWRAADGSSLLAHWMSNTYWEGDDATMPETLSLASVTSPSSAIITAAKAADAARSDLILRLYQPTNEAQHVSIITAVDATNARVRSALEKEFVNQPPNGSVRNTAANSLTVQMDRALVTVRLPGVL